MATYTITGDDFNLGAQPIYGSSRLGQFASGADMGVNPPDENEFFSGKTSYELSNHLGNVLAVIADRKSMVDDIDPDILVNYFNVEYTSITDYYPFGMQMPERSFDGGYRFGFNGKEKDNELTGEGNSLDYSARIYTSRLGRWLSVDPLAHEKPALTPFRGFLNNPITFLDPAGKTEFRYTIVFNKGTGEMFIEISTHNSLMSSGPRPSSGPWMSSSSWYDYRTMNITIIDPDAKKGERITTKVDKEIIYENGVQDSDHIFLSSFGDIKKENSFD